MEILYSDKCGSAAFEKLGIKAVCLKLIESLGDDESFTKKRHFHTSYELHAIAEGSQKYETAEGEITAECGDCLMFSPKTEHRLTATEYPLRKYAFTFVLDEDSDIAFVGKDLARVRIPDSVLSGFGRIMTERGQALSASASIIEGRALECLVDLLRALGAYEQKGADAAASEDMRLFLAKQYIKDNIRSNPSVSEIARYCHMSERHLGRLFKKREGRHVSEYISALRIETVEALLRESEVSLSDIARATGFKDEYYFNAYFKKHSGMPPGEFRRKFLQ